MSFDPINIATLKDIAQTYTEDSLMPLNHGIDKLVNDLIMASSNRLEVPSAKELHAISSDLKIFLDDKDVYMTSAHAQNEPGLLSKLVLKFTSGITNDVATVRFGLTHSSKISIDFLEIQLADWARFSSNDEPAITYAITHNAIIEGFNGLSSENRHKLAWLYGLTARNIDFIEKYGTGPEAKLVTSLFSIINAPDNQALLGHITGNTQLAWEAYAENSPSLAVAPSNIKSVILENRFVSLEGASNILSTIRQQLNASDDNRSLASLAPLALSDEILDVSKIVAIASIMEQYLEMAEPEDINHMLKVLDYHGYTIDETLSEDMSSVIKAAQASCHQSATSTKKKRFSL